MLPPDSSLRDERWQRLRAAVARPGAAADSAEPRGPRHALTDDLSGLVRAVLVVVVLAVVMATFLFWRAWPREVEAAPLPAAGLGRPDESRQPTMLTPEGAVASPGTATRMVVHVVGRVRRPGLVRLPLGSRVADAVRAAGGLRAGTDVRLVNLARPLTDGEQLVVASEVDPAIGSPAPQGGSSATGQGASTGLVDLNSATATDLEELDGIGPVLAARILDFRDKQGRFTSVDELQGVSGIGPKIFASLRTQVRV